ncbi:MAG: hypothetical protein ACTSQH_05065 [Candidatus Hodarchaeales archaeon]
MREGIVTALFVQIIVAAVVGVLTGQILLGTDAPAYLFSKYSFNCISLTLNI